jgi:beta propeller repeat protein
MDKGPRVTALLVVAVTMLLLTPSAGCITHAETRVVQLTEGPYQVLRERDSVSLSGDYLLYSRTGMKKVKDNVTGRPYEVWDNGTYVMDITDRSEVKIADDVLDASISNNFVVWRDGDEIVHLNSVTGANMILPLGDGAKPLTRPDIQGHLVVWADRRNDPVPEDDEDIVDIYLYNVTTEMEMRLTTSRSNKGAPSIGGDLVVWADERNGNFDIYALDLSNGTEYQVTDDPNAQLSPKASTMAIAWMDTRTTVHPKWREDIFYFDLVLGEERQASDTGLVKSYDLWADKIVWEDTSRYNKPYESGDIFLHNISKNRTKKYFASDWSQWSPSVSEGKIVWTDSSVYGGEVLIKKKVERPVFGLDYLTVFFLLALVVVALIAIYAFRRAGRKAEKGPEEWKRRRREKGRTRKRRKEEKERERRKRKGPPPRPKGKGRRRPRPPKGRRRRPPRRR